MIISFCTLTLTAQTKYLPVQCLSRRPLASFSLWSVRSGGGYCRGKSIADLADNGPDSGGMA